ncbi:hypothetical protein MSAN_01297300 [Mycena sanguinolenta]|uniref:Uncharacterized protein n=1 Tax=Mycena sanguinolenta TaxID=230812 RepID=A0A8H6YJ51_9AGAR|nr:hypothetical protein MSAN_01297300 [Mycena sanguinolenta]
MSRPRILSMFVEGKEAKRARVEAEIAERSERFRASPTVKIGNVTVINPVSTMTMILGLDNGLKYFQTYEGPNPFQIPELLDPENEGVLLASPEYLPNPETVRRYTKQRNRAKSEAYVKTPWVFEEQGRAVQSLKNPRHSLPPLPAKEMYSSEEDPFRKGPLSRPTATGNLLLTEEEKSKVNFAPRVFEKCLKQK